MFTDKLYKGNSVDKQMTRTTQCGGSQSFISQSIFYSIRGLANEDYSSDDLQQRQIPRSQGSRSQSSRPQSQRSQSCVLLPPHKSIRYFTGFLLQMLF